jgi:hypothetical protein
MLANKVFVYGCATAFAVAGCYMGQLLHGPTALSLLPTIAGAAGGFGIGWA